MRGLKNLKKSAPSYIRKNKEEIMSIENRILRLPHVKNKTGYSRSSIYLKVAEGTFPAPISLGGRSVGWLESEVDAWIEARIAYTRGTSLTR